jgi:hypothetical protein
MSLPEKGSGGIRKKAGREEIDSDAAWAEKNTGAPFLLKNCRTVPIRTFVLQKSPAKRQ